MAMAPTMYEMEAMIRGYHGYATVGCPDWRRGLMRQRNGKYS